MNARELHDAYERLAPQFGYETRADTKVFDPESPNGRLMQAAIDEVFGRAIALLAAVEESDGLVRELRDCRSIIGNLCAEGRPPSMSIPARPEVDEDLRMCATIDKAAARIAALEAELASVKAHAEAMCERLLSDASDNPDQTIGACWPEPALAYRRDFPKEGT